MMIFFLSPSSAEERETGSLRVLVRGVLLAPIAVVVGDVDGDGGGNDFMPDECDCCDEHVDDVGNFLCIITVGERVAGALAWEDAE